MSEAQLTAAHGNVLRELGALDVPALPMEPFVNNQGTEIHFWVALPTGKTKRARGEKAAMPCPRLWKEVAGLARVAEASEAQRAELRRLRGVQENECVATLAAFGMQVDETCAGFEEKLQGALLYEAPADAPPELTAIMSNTVAQVSAAMRRLYDQAEALKRSREEADRAALAQRVASLNAAAALELKKWQKAREVLGTTPEGLAELMRLDLAITRAQKKVVVTPPAGQAEAPKGRGFLWGLMRGK